MINTSIKIFVASLVMIFQLSINAQDLNQLSVPLSGNLKVDSKLLLDNNKLESTNLLPNVRSKKNPMIAGLLSMILPGAGEFYNGDYVKAAIFLGIETAIITVALTYDKKGEDQTNVFEDFADENWSPVKYAEWLNNHIEGANIPINPNTSLLPWERVNWDSINFYESKFSHKLPKHGDQQYYELIGKYPQYSPGWNQFNPSEPDYHILPPIFLEYSKMRGKANDYFAVSSNAIKVMYVNHLLSVIDAIWSAARYNSNIDISVRMERNNLVYKEEYYPKLYLKYNF